MWHYLSVTCMAPILFFIGLMQHLTSGSGSDSDYSDLQGGLKICKKDKQLKMEEKSGALTTGEITEEGNVRISCKWLAMEIGQSTSDQCLYTRLWHHQCVSNRPLTRYVKLWVVHAPVMPGTFSPPPRVSDPDMHHARVVMDAGFAN